MRSVFDRNVVMLRIPLQYISVSSTVKADWSTWMIIADESFKVNAKDKPNSFYIVYQH
jgi:hypothetical protein